MPQANFLLLLFLLGGLHSDDGVLGAFIEL